MGTATSKYEQFDSEEVQEIQHAIEEKGIAGAQDLMQEKRGRIEINIGVAGGAGVGKSSFINAIRGVKNGDMNSAKIDVVEITDSEPVSYTYCQNISIVDLPAIGTPSCPNLNIFCQKVHLETYNVFFILTATRFTEHEYELARKVKFMGKRFFLIWTKIDQDELSERRHNHDLNAMVEKIRAHLYENVKNLGIREEEIFVISNHYPDKWDFERLVQATTTLPVSQRIQLVTILSKDILAEKIKKLRGGINFWFRLGLLIVRLFTCSRGNEFTVIVQRVESYISELGFPLEDSKSFNELNEVLQNKVRRFYPRREMDVTSWLRVLGFDVENESISRRFAYDSLLFVLDKMEETAMEVLEFTAGKSVRDNDI